MEETKKKRRDASEEREESDGRLHAQTLSMTCLGWLGSLDGPFHVKGEELRALASPVGKGRSDVGEVAAKEGNARRAPRDS